MKKYVRCSSADEWAWFRSSEGTSMFEQFLSAVSDAISNELDVTVDVVWSPYSSSGAMEEFDIEIQSGTTPTIQGIAIDTSANYAVKYNGVKLISMLHSGELDNVVNLFVAKVLRYLKTENS